MSRKPCCEKVELKKGPWTPEEDKKLVAYVEKHGHGNWRSLPLRAGLQRCAKSCRLRWINYLKPDIKRGNFTLEEDRTIIQLHALLGNKWSTIAAHLPKRTDNEIKNYWNTNIKKRLIRMGIDPVTHKPIAKIIEKANDNGQSKEMINISHMAQWESARLEAEARESMLQVVGSCSSHPPHLILSKIQTQPSLSSKSLSTKHNSTMYAIMLTTEDHISNKLPVSTNMGQIISESSISCKGNGNIIETSSSEEEIMESYVSNLQDDDIMVAVEAFRAARRVSVPQ